MSPRGVYERGPSKATPKHVRTLGPDEPRPEGEPRRYAARHGYVRLRWRVGVGQYVEALEHRLVVGAQPGVHVHHRNHVTDDNRPGNLEPLTPAEHAAHHGLIRRRFDRARAAAMYRDGMSTVEIGHALGVNPATVYRGLVRAGVATRSMAEAAALERLPLDEGAVVELHLAGVRAEAIARQLGCSSEPIHRIIRAHGLTPHRPGRPSRVA
jgi:hypothetical protein